MERSALQLIRLHTDAELKESLEYACQDFIALDMLVHSIVYPDTDIVILELQRQLNSLYKWHRYKGASLIIPHEENIKLLLESKRSKK